MCSSLMERQAWEVEMRMRTLGILIFAVVLIVVGSWVVIEKFRVKKKIVGIARWVTNQEYDRNIAAFKESLTRNGFIDGVDIEYIVRNPDLDAEKQKIIIKEFIDRGVDLIYSLTTPGTLIAREMTQKIPIIFSIVTYPAEAKIVRSIASSGNNLVGTRNYIPMERQFRVFKSLYPNVKSIGFVHRKNEPNSVIQLRRFRDVLKGTGINVFDINPTSVEELSSKLNALKGQLDALYSACDTLVQGGGEEVVIAFAERNKLPDFTCNRSGVQKGSLIGNVADFAAIGGISGEKAAKVLKGTNPSDLKTEWPSEDFILLNLTTAEKLGLKISPEFIREVSKVFH